MQSMKTFLFLGLVSLAGARGLIAGKKAKLDINQKVYIENATVLGDGAGEGALNQCTAFAASHVSNPAAPTVKVCGTGIKATVYLLAAPPAHHDLTTCRQYFSYQHTIGQCDTGMPSSTCEEASPATVPWMQTAQSYFIEQC